MFTETVSTEEITNKIKYLIDHHATQITILDDRGGSGGWVLTHDANVEFSIARNNARRMADTGGGFHSRLGELFFKADMSNAKRLIDAFPHEFLKEEK
jgi:hypothetical protein